MASVLLTSTGRRLGGGSSRNAYVASLFRNSTSSSNQYRLFSSSSNPEATTTRVRDRVFPSPHRNALYRTSTVRVIGVPMTYGQPIKGTDNGPKLLRERGLTRLLQELDWQIQDDGDLDFAGLFEGIEQSNDNNDSNEDGTSPHFPGKAKNHRHVGAVGQLLATTVEETLRAGQFPLILGGDHSIGLGSLAGILNARPDTGVIWVDAHADINTPSMSESGNMHGMPIGLLLDGLMNNATTGDPATESIPGLEWLAGKPRLRADSIVYIGLRDVDPAERKVLRDFNIAAFTMHDIDRYGIGGVLDRALNHLTKFDPHRPLHLSYDIDAVDPHLAPATGTTVRGGLTYREAHYVAEAVAYSGNLMSAEIVEVNPNMHLERSCLDARGSEETVDLGLQLITSFMGKSII